MESTDKVSLEVGPDSSGAPVVAQKADERPGWGNKLEFFLTLVGFAVGLGNVWRFPYLAYSNGGGAFLVPYVIILISMGVPLFFMEMAFGQFCSLGSVTAWKITPLFKGVGVAGVIVCAYITMYYNVIVAWCLYFFFSSMASEVPWKNCGNWWNTAFCRTGHFNASIENITAEQVRTPSEEFFYNKVLQMSDSIEQPGQIVWQLVVCLFLAWLIVFLVLLKGIGSLGKASYVFTLVPYFLLTVMLVRGATLEGAREGVEFYIRPNFAKLLEAKVWGDAATQICYSLGVVQGCVIAMSSYNEFHHNARRDGTLIPLVNCGTSLYAGFVIFSVLGFMANNKGTTVDKVATSGPGLVFVVYPEALAQMPVAPLWSILFFFMMCCLGSGTQFTATETTLVWLLDEFPDVLRRGYRPLLVRALGCTAYFLVGLPMVTQGGFYWFKLMDEYSANYNLLVTGLLMFIGINYLYGYKKFSEDVAIMLGHRPGLYWKFTWCFLAPAVLVAITIFKALQQKPLEFQGRVFPAWTMSIAWLITASPVVAFILIGIYQCMQRGGYQALKDTIKSSPDWGPALPENRVGTVYEYRDKQQPVNAVTWSHGQTSNPVKDSFTIADDTGYKFNSVNMKKGGKINDAFVLEKSYNKNNNNDIIASQLQGTSEHETQTKL